MSKIAFIILHYLTTEETIKCVESINSLECNDSELFTIIVDNASPNQSGTILLDRYKDDDGITVILNGNNSGFSNGNNLGISYAKEHIDPDYYIVANNDVQFLQNDILVQIVNEYRESQFDVLGPDIYNTRLHVHQSPLRNTVPSLAEVNRTIRLNKIVCNTYPFSYPLMWLEKRKEANITDAVGYDRRQDDVSLYGACLIFSKKYVERRMSSNEEKKVFYPETFLYYEEALMMLWNTKNDAKSVYSPKLKVNHAESVATEKDSKNQTNRWYRGARNIIDSASIYREKLLKYNKE